MTLIIKAVSYKDAPLTSEISVRFEEQGGSIGRSPDNQMVLPDPEKYISRLHAEIQYERGQYFIQDCSAGGTYLEQQGQQLQQARAALTDGEKLRIGEYELVVTIIESAPAFSQPYQSYVEPVRQLDLADSSALGGLSGPQPSVAVKTETHQSFIEQPDASVFHQSFTPPEAQADPRLQKKEEVKDDLDFGDLLSTLDHLSASPSAPDGRAFKPSASSPSLLSDFPELPADFFEEESMLESAKMSAATSPHLDTADLPASPFNTAATDQEELVAANELPASPFSSNPFPEAGSGREADPAAPFSLETAIHSVEAREPEAVAPIPKPHVAPQEARVRMTAPSNTERAAADSELIRAFLTGAGIDDSQFLSPEQWSELFRTSGELLRSMVEGLMCVLRARAELKSQFRVSVTTMRSVDNNPLKFTPNVDDALRLILAPTNPGFLTPKEAVREGFADIMNHQMAMTAGIQAALADILRGFDPELIEKAQGEGIQFQKKAKCWEHYTNQYPKLKASAQEDFFGDAFGDAYEQQMQLLSRSSKQ